MWSAVGDRSGGPLKLIENQPLVRGDVIEELDLSSFAGQVHDLLRPLHLLGGHLLQWQPDFLGANLQFRRLDRSESVATRRESSSRATRR